MTSPRIVQMAALPPGRARQNPLPVLRAWEWAEPEPWTRVHGAAIEVMAAHSGMRIDADLIGALPALRLIANFGVGVDAIDLAAAEAAGVKVTHTPGLLSDDVADLALALILCGLRGVVSGHEAVRAGRWGKTPIALGRSARGRRLGVFGLGRVGIEIAQRAEAVGMSVGYVARSRKNDAPYPFFETLGELADWSDVLVLCAPGGGATEGVVGAEILNRLGCEGLLVNVARGSLVDEAALAAALHEGRLGGAALDVFLSEPFVSPALIAAPRLIATPHIGSATEETRAAMADHVWDNVEAWLEGRPLKDVVPVSG